MLDQDRSHPIQTNVRLKEEARQRTYVSAASAAAWGALILCILLAALSIYQQQPPRSVPASAIPTDFSSGRAMRHVDRSFGLPQIPQMSTTYPADAIPVPTALSDSPT